MPEGDTIHKVARYLCAALTNQRITRLLVRGGQVADLLDAEVVEATSKGKHLFIELSSGDSLRVHLGLYGAWHRYRVGEPWSKPERQAALILSTGSAVYVCFNAKEVEILKRGGFRRRDRENRLGPDLTRCSPPTAVLLRRVRELLRTDIQVTDMLLDQRIASGIGNVYKSEVLFLERCDPRTRFSELSSDAFAALYRTAGRLLQRNLGDGPRVTRAGADGRGMLWVYGRAGLACFRCGEPVARETLGRMPRSTYWCPACQSGRPGCAPARRRATPMPRDSVKGSERD